MEKIQEKIDLEFAVLKHKQLYYSGKAEISDSEFDALEDNLRSLYPNSAVLDIVGFDSSGDSIKNKIAHKHPMKSLSKFTDKEKLLNWMDAKQVIFTDKVDGMACEIKYYDGEFVSASTRGNGLIGEDITKYFEYIPVPSIIDCHLPGESFIRGELCCRKDRFDKLVLEMETRKLDTPKSCRNIAAGLVHRKDNIDLCESLSFYAYDFMINQQNGPETEIDKLSWLASIGFNVVRHKLIPNNGDFVEKHLDRMILFQNSAVPYPTDGFVFAYNSVHDQADAGETDHHPKGKVAYKWQTETAVTRVQNIDISVGYTGKLTFVANVTPVDVSDALISRVTLHNYKYIKDHEITEGSLIEITRSGEVIPKHIRTVSGQGTFDFPELCPFCDSKLVLSQTNVDLICPDYYCKKRSFERLSNWINTLGIKELGEATAKLLFSVCDVKEIHDLYDESLIKKILNQPGYGEKSVQKIQESINKSKKIPLHLFLSAVGIEGIGKVAAKNIEAICGSVRDFFDLTKIQLEDINGIGNTLAENIINSMDTVIYIYKRLRSNGVEIFVTSKNKSGKLSGEVFCVTGKLTKPRKSIVELIESNGGTVKASVSKDVTILICDSESTSTKYKKAIALGTTIITEEDLYGRLS